MSLGQIGTRIALAIGALLAVGVVLRLIVAILSPVVPAWLMKGLGDGWTMLFDIISPALGPIFAVVILFAIWWVIVGRWR